MFFENLKEKFKKIADIHRDDEYNNQYSYILRRIAVYSDEGYHSLPIHSMIYGYDYQIRIINRLLEDGFTIYQYYAGYPRIVVSWSDEDQSEYFCNR